MNKTMNSDNPDSWQMILPILTKMKKIISSTVLSFMHLCWAASVKARALIDLESGLVFTGYNDVRVNSRV